MKELSLRDIEALRSEGATVDTHRKSIDVPGVVTELKRIVEKQNDNHELLSAVEALVTAVESLSITVNPIDMQPILEALSVMKSEVRQSLDHKPCAYRFKIERDSRRDMQEVIATPIDGS